MSYSLGRWPTCGREDVGSGSGGSWLLSAARRVGVWRRPPLGALHELVVQSPDGRSRTFRSGPRIQAWARCGGWTQDLLSAIDVSVLSLFVYDSVSVSARGTAIDVAGWLTIPGGKVSDGAAFPSLDHHCCCLMPSIDAHATIDEDNLTCPVSSTGLGRRRRTCRGSRATGSRWCAPRRRAGAGGRPCCQPRRPARGRGSR